MEHYWIGFSRVKGIGGARIQLLINLFGDLERAWLASEKDLLAAGLHKSLVESILTARRTLDLENELRRVIEAGFSILTTEHPDYPQRLRELVPAPPVLYRWGELVENDHWAVAVVGTRRPSRYGELTASDIARELSGNGITIVSGLARGIDGLAHRTALESGGRTLAVLGSGLDRVYPPEHRNLAEQITQRGAILTEYPLGTEPEPYNFPPRNRIISGLSLAVVIVEAGTRSGALITADFASDQGREVFAVPGDINRPTCQGTNALIRAGAHPVTCPEDILEVLNFSLIVGQDRVVDHLPEDPLQRKVLAAVMHEPVHIDELGARLEMPISELNAALVMLELNGKVRQIGGMKFIGVREPAGTYRIE